MEKLQFKGKWRVFLISFAACFLMAALPKLGLKIPSFNNLVSPASKHQDNFDSVVKPKLEIKSNKFSLNKPRNIVNQVQAAEDYDQAASYIAVDFDSGDVIVEKDSSKRLSIASITKVMTAVTALDLSKPSDIFTVSKEATVVEPTNMGLIEGQKWSLEELLNALLLTSSNDAAEAIKINIDQRFGQDTFTHAMNAKASILGLKNTHFDNPQGYDGDHYSSTGDLAVLMNLAINSYPLIAEIVKKDYQFYSKTENHKMADLYNWNGLLGVYPGVRGIKIGNTDDAGVTTSVLSEREGKSILVILLGAPGVLERDLWTSQLLDLGYSKKWGMKGINITEEQLKEKYATWKYF